MVKAVGMGLSVIPALRLIYGVDRAERSRRSHSQ